MHKAREQCVAFGLSEGDASERRTRALDNKGAQQQSVVRASSHLAVFRGAPVQSMHTVRQGLLQAVCAQGRTLGSEV